MPIISDLHVEKLIDVEAGARYNDPPPEGKLPFVLVERDNPVLISAPHGCRTFRNRNGERWHQEDEYTVGMALLIGELCQVPVMATMWRTDDSDPNDSYEAASPYKQALRRLVEERDIRWVIDLHGTRPLTPRMASGQLVDLGVGNSRPSMPADMLAGLRSGIEARLGPGVTERGGCKGWPASVRGRSITAFAHHELGLGAVQIEMKPAVRVVRRRAEATMYRRSAADGGGPYQARVEDVKGMMQALVEFVEQVKEKI
jgi:hypothetical protein